MPETSSLQLDKPKPTSFTITVDENKSEKVTENLQEAFLKFKKYKEVSC